MPTRTFVAACVLLIGLATPAGAQQYPIQSDAGCTVTSSIATVGGTVSVTCRGYSAEATVTFTLFSTPIHLGTATADAQGVVDFSFTVPDVSHGDHYVEASGASPEGTLVQRIALHIDGTGGVTVTPTPRDNSGELPHTGSSTTTVMARSAIGLLAVGGLLVLAARKRRSHAST
jgi:titin